jgi:Omp85 superfamily domain
VLGSISMSRALTLFLIAALNFAGEVNAQQQNGSAVATREQQIEAEQRQKATTLTSGTLPHKERLFLKTMNRISDALQVGPVHVQVGGLPGGAGLSAGPGLEWRSRSDDIRLGTSLIGSVNQYYMGRSGLLLPNLADRRLSIGVFGAYSYAPTLDYYGPGPDSLKANRTDYLEEDTSVDLRFRWSPPRTHVSWDANLGLLFVNVGPGTSSSIPSTETVFGPAQAPGIDVQSNFARAAYLIDVNYLDSGIDYGNILFDYRNAPFDYRHVPLNPHKGIRAVAGWQQYFDIVHGDFSFGRLSADAEGYIPFWNKKRVIALHAGTELSYHRDDQVVPFYLQPTLGGPDDNRGFRRYRFYDENVIRLNAEYRWEVTSGFNLAAFGDAGKVFNKPGQISLSNLESSVGFGLRFTTYKRLLARIDTGFSHEGFQVWLQLRYPF